MLSVLIIFQVPIKIHVYRFFVKYITPSTEKLRDVTVKNIQYF